MNAPFYNDTFRPPPSGDPVPPFSCTLLPSLYPGQAPPNHVPRPTTRTTQEQEGFADGFVRALASLHQQGDGFTCVVSASVGSGASSLRTSASSNLCGAVAGSGVIQATRDSGLNSAAGGVETLVYNTNLAVNCHAHQHHRVTMTTAHQEFQDGIAMTTPYQADPDASERKRLRNRIAATRCRRRKLERIARLEEHVRVLRSLNGRLVDRAALLHGQVGALRCRAAKHLAGGCQIPMVTDGEGGLVQGGMDQAMGGHALMDNVPHVSWDHDGKQEQYF